MRIAISKFFRDIETLFRGRNLIWQGIAVAATYFLVISGFDWWIVQTFHGVSIRTYAGLAGSLGFFMPVFAPLLILAVGGLRDNMKLIRTGLLLAQAEITALLLSFFYKALTGRPGPNEFHAALPLDISHIFNFGFLRGGVFWGWPSSHVITSVAGAVTLMLLYPHNKLIKYLALAYAIYMGISVSITFHWFSDGVAAAIFATVIAFVVVRGSTEQ